MARAENKLTAREMQIALRKTEKAVLQDEGSLYFTVEEKIQVSGGFVAA